MATVTAQDVCKEADVATSLAAIIGTVTTYYGHSVTRIGSDRYLVVVAYDGT